MVRRAICLQIALPVILCNAVWANAAKDKDAIKGKTIFIRGFPWVSPRTASRDALGTANAGDDNHVR